MNARIAPSTLRRSRGRRPVACNRRRNPRKRALLSGGSCTVKAGRPPSSSIPVTGKYSETRRWRFSTSQVDWNTVLIRVSPAGGKEKRGQTRRPLSHDFLTLSVPLLSPPQKRRDVEVVDQRLDPVFDRVWRLSELVRVIAAGVEDGGDHCEAQVAVHLVCHVCAQAGIGIVA